MTIYLDAGHGFRIINEDTHYDPGAVNKERGWEEAKLAWTVVSTLGSVARKAGYTVKLVRPKFETPMSLAQRCSWLRGLASTAPGLVVSVHFNSAISKANGFEVWYHRLVDEALARAIVTEMGKLEYPTRGARRDQAYGRTLGILRTGHPSVLVECEFVQAVEWVEKWLDREERVKYCQAIVRGIGQVFPVKKKTG